MADDALHYRQRHARVGRKRDEGVPKREEGRHYGLAAAAFNPNAHRDVRRLEYAAQPLIELPLAVEIHFRYRWVNVWRLNAGRGRAFL